MLDIMFSADVKCPKQMSNFKNAGVKCTDHYSKLLRNKKNMHGLSSLYLCKNPVIMTNRYIKKTKYSFCFSQKVLQYISMASRFFSLYIILEFLMAGENNWMVDVIY